MEIELENPFGLHAPTRLRLDPRADVAAVLARARDDHGLACNRLLYRGRLLKPSEVLGHVVNPDLSNKITTHVSEANLAPALASAIRQTSPAMSPSPSPNATRAPVAPNAQAAAPRNGVWQQIQNYLDLSLLGRLAFFILILGGDAAPSRRLCLFILAIVIYIYQVATRTAQAPVNDLPPDLAPATPANNSDISQQEYQHMGLVEIIERFLVGLFASLYPGWDPN